MSVKISCERILLNNCDYITLDGDEFRCKNTKAFRVESLEAKTIYELPRDYLQDYPCFYKANNNRIIIHTDLNTFYEIRRNNIYTEDDFEEFRKLIRMSLTRYNIIKNKLKEEANGWCGNATYRYSYGNNEEDQVKIKCERVLVNYEKAYKILDADGPLICELPKEYVEGPGPKVFDMKQYLRIFDKDHKKFEIIIGEKYYQDAFEVWWHVIGDARDRLREINKKLEKDKYVRLEEIKKKSEWSGEITFKF